MTSPSTLMRLYAMAAICLLALAGALVAQHVFDMQPCPWCILQRAIYILIALSCLAAAWCKPRKGQVGLVSLTLLLSLAGAASAVYQHLVAAQMYSCKLTLADKILNVTGLESLLPFVFAVTASCADAAVSMLGIPFEYWSLALFVALGAAAAWVLARPR